MKIRGAKITLLAGALILMSAWAASAQTKVGIVDLQRAMADSLPGKQALESLKKTYDSLNAQLSGRAESLRAMEQKLIEMRQELQQKSLLFSQEVRRQKEDDLLRRQRDFARSRDELVRLRSEAEDDFNRERSRVTSQIQRELRDVIVKIARDEKFTLILERSVVLFFDSEKVDLTDTVIRAYNKAKQ